MTSKDVCNQCGGEYKYIGMHWSRNSSCEYPSLSQKQREITTGLVMGDGHIQRSQNKSPVMDVAMISENYLEYIDNQFGTFGNGVNLKKSSEEHVCSNNYSDLYRWRSMAHPELREFAEWYSTGNKVWPDDITLTPTVLKHWYCCDGSWKNSDGSDRIQISMANEVEYTDKVSSMFENVGLPLPSNYYIYERKDGRTDCNAEFTVDQSKKLWEYMGEPLPDFEYKWPNEYR